MTSEAPRDVPRPIMANRQTSDVSTHADGVAATSNPPPKEPVLVFAPYLPLREAVTAGEWWIGPLKGFEGEWRDDRFRDLSRTFIGSFHDARGQRVDNPALIAHKRHGANGAWPGEARLRNLQLALDFAVLDSNHPWKDDDISREGWLTGTSDNSRLVVWSIDTADGRLALSDGVMVRTLVGGVRIDDKLVMRAPTELHMPLAVSLAQDLLEALLSVFSGERAATDATLAQRLSIATSWLAQSWRNTESIREAERIVMLKTGFEALTNDSTWRAADRLDELFGQLRAHDVTDESAADLLWRPSEKKDLTCSWIESGKEKTKTCTPLNHWFQSFADARNRIIHKGDISTTAYGGPAERYRGPYIYIGERLLREACRVALLQFGYEDLWKTHCFRLISRLVGTALGPLTLEVAHLQEASPLPGLPAALEARPIYLVERRHAGGWLAWTARQGVTEWQPVRFPDWAKDRSDNIISDDAMGLMKLSSRIIADAVAETRSFDDLYRSDESGKYQTLWRRFFETHLVTIAQGQRGLLNPNEVFAWTSIQPESELFQV
jgi:hypothetical protein